MRARIRGRWSRTDMTCCGRNDLTLPSLSPCLVGRPLCMSIRSERDGGRGGGGEESRIEGRQSSEMVDARDERIRKRPGKRDGGHKGAEAKIRGNSPRRCEMECQNRT